MVKDDNCYRRSKSAAAIMKVCVIQLNLNDAECYIFIFYFCSFFTPTSTLLKIYVDYQ